MDQKVSSTPADDSDNDKPPFLERSIEGLIFSSRWLMAPIYLGLIVCLGILVFAIGWTTLPGIWGGLSLVGILATTAAGLMHKEFHKHSWNDWYEQLLGAALPFSILTLIAVVIGGIVQILPTVIINRAQNLEGHARSVSYAVAVDHACRVVEAQGAFLALRVDEPVGEHTTFSRRCSSEEGRVTRGSIRHRM